MAAAATPSAEIGDSHKTGSTKLWGGRFAKDTDKAVLKWVDSIPVDRNMQVEDTWGSIAHNCMLGRQGINDASYAGKIMFELFNIQNGMLDGSFKLGTKQDDVHMDVEANVIERLGSNIGGRMHATRSRNDQVVTDSKLMCRRNLLLLREKTISVVKAFLAKAEGQLNNVMIAYTHVQHAQPVSVAFWLTHYAAVFLRDLKRLKQAYDTTDENPLGSGAISGTSFPIDRELTTKLMGFQFVQDHSLDAGSARDFLLETLGAISILNTTFSRLAEELILWSSYEFRSVTLDDGFAMGSSMMPQKKNPGTLELLRGRAGRINGLMSAGFTLMKGLPSGYNRDFHEDKEIIVDVFNLILPATEIVPALISSTTLNLARMAELPEKSFSTATELANFLVAKCNKPFREAHHIVGTLVGALSRAGKDFTERDFCMKHLSEVGIEATRAQIDAVLDPKTVMESYNSLGGTGPKAVQAMMDKMNAQVAAFEAQLKADQARVSNAYEACRNIASRANTIQTVEDINKLLAEFAPRD